MEQFLNFLDTNSLLMQLKDFLFGFLEQGLNFFDQQNVITQVGIMVGLGIITVLGTIDLVKRLSKLIFVAIVLFALWFVYTNYVA